MAADGRRQTFAWDQRAERLTVPALFDWAERLSVALLFDEHLRPARPNRARALISGRA